MPDGHPVKLPPPLVEEMTDPEKEKLITVPYATDSSLYIFLRLPAPLEEFYAPGIFSDIAEQVAVESDSGIKGSYDRPWSEFKKVPSSPHVAVSVSPIRKWTPEGTYSFDTPPSKVAIRDRHYASFELPVHGEVSLQPAEVRTVSDMVVDASWEKPWTYRLSFSNAMDKDGLPYFKIPETLDIQVTVTQQTGIGTVTLKRKVQGTLSGGKEASVLAYEIPLYLPQIYAPDAKVQLHFTVENRYGDVANFTHTMPTPTSHHQVSIFDRFQLKLSEDIVPAPFYLFTLNPDTTWPGLGLKRYLEELEAGLEICPPEKMREDMRIRDCSSLEYQKNWVTATDESVAEVPLKLAGNSYYADLALAYRAFGGFVHGSLSFGLPEDPYKLNSESLPWKATLALPEVSMVIPPSPTITTGRFMRPSVGVNVIPLAIPMIPKLEGIKGKRQSEKDYEGIQFKTEKRVVKPGQEFWVEIILPYQIKGDRTGPAKFEKLTIGKIEEAAKVIEIKLKEAEGQRDDIYTLRPMSAHDLGGRRYRLNFQFPKYMPDGHYEAQFKTGQNFYATYFYDSDYHAYQGKDYIPVNLWNVEQQVSLSDLNILGDPKIQPPSALGKKNN